VNVLAELLQLESQDTHIMKVNPAKRDFINFVIVMLPCPFSTIHPKGCDLWNLPRPVRREHH
jgi:hypothetical protein